MSRLRPLLLLPAICGLGLQSLVAQAPVVINDSVDVYQLGLYLAILEDPDGRLTIEEASSASWAERFTVNTKSFPNYGNTASAFWVRFTLQMDDSTPETGLLEHYLLEIGYPHFNAIDLYYRADADQFVMHSRGLERPVVARNFSNRNLIFDLPKLGDNQQTFYLRLESEAAMVLPLRIFTVQKFALQMASSRLLLGLYYGILIAMMLYNLFLYFSIRERSYVYYVLTILTYGLHQFYFDGLGYLYFNFWSGQFTDVHFALMWGFLFFVFGLSFGRHYLLLGEHAPRLNRIIFGFGILFLGFAVTAALIESLRTINLFANIGLMIYLVLIWIIGIVVLRKGFRPARFFVLAYALYSVGMAFRMGRNMGLLPDHFVFVYGMHVGSVLEAVLLSLGLGDRINILQREKVQAYTNARDRVARNLHDEVGATLSGISLFAQAIENEEDPEKSRLVLQRIIRHTDEAQEKMRDLHWTIDPANDSWDALLAKLRRYASDLFEGIDTEYNIDLPSQITLPTLDMETRQHFWLIYKEIVNNIGKHAQAEFVEIKLSQHGRQLHLEVADRGKGFDAGILTSSSGLKNIVDRTNKLGGRYELTTAPGAGTQWSVEFNV